MGGQGAVEKYRRGPTGERPTGPKMLTKEICLSRWGFLISTDER
jgi:hypothetical protein